MITRKEYLAKSCTFIQYYSQFITESLISYVSERIGIEEIQNSTDNDFNNIPIKYWDQLNVMSFINYKLFKDIQYPEYSNSKCKPFSKCDNVSLAKAAAEIIKNRLKVTI